MTSECLNHQGKRHRRLSSCTLHIYDKRHKRHCIFKYRIFKFSLYAQSWQCWHFCTTFNGNKFEIVDITVIFKANLHLS